MGTSQASSFLVVANSTASTSSTSGFTLMAANSLASNASISKEAGSCLIPSPNSSLICWNFLSSVSA
jgi:hypothetical protein